MSGLVACPQVVYISLVMLAGTVLIIINTLYMSYIIDLDNECALKDRTLHPAEKCQFRTEKCQFRTEKCHFLSPRCAPNDRTLQIHQIYSSCIDGVIQQMTDKGKRGNGPGLPKPTKNTVLLTHSRPAKTAHRIFGVWFRLREDGAGPPRAGEKCQLRIEKCQLRTEKCQLRTDKCLAAARRLACSEALLYSQAGEGGGLEKISQHTRHNVVSQERGMYTHDAGVAAGVI